MHSEMKKQQQKCEGHYKQGAMTCFCRENNKMPSASTSESSSKGTHYGIHGRELCIGMHQVRTSKLQKDALIKKNPIKSKCLTKIHRLLGRSPLAKQTMQHHHTNIQPQQDLQIAMAKHINGMSVSTPLVASFIC